MEGDGEVPQVSDVVHEYRHAGLGLFCGCPLRQGDRHLLCEFLSSFSSFVDRHALTTKSFRQKKNKQHRTTLPPNTNHNTTQHTKKIDLAKIGLAQVGQTTNH